MAVCKDCEHYNVCLVHCSESVLRNRGVCEHFKQGWISAEEKLPEKQKPVLVCAKDKTFGYQRTLTAAHIGFHECSTEDYGWQEYEGDTEYDEQNDCFWIPECWYETNAVEDNTNWIIDYDYEVTHWMPLPRTEGLNDDT